MTVPVTIYRPRRPRIVRGGVSFALCGAVILLAGSSALHKSPGGADARALWLVTLGCFSLGFAGITFLGVLRGLPRLTMTPVGVRLDTMFGSLEASWQSLAQFQVTPLTWSRRPRQSAIASIIGPEVSRRLRTGSSS
jgi:hypothetical protein